MNIRFLVLDEIVEIEKPLLDISTIPVLFFFGDQPNHLNSTVKRILFAILNL
jgi:hypothetical protein